MILSPASVQSISLYGTFIATFVLVIVTAWYSIITREILKDNQRDREIRWIERKLQRLYYPLLITLDNYLGNLGDPDSNLPDFPLRSVDALRNKLYLGSNALREKLEELRERVRKEPIPTDLSMKVHNFVPSEVYKLRNRLEELTTDKTKDSRARKAKRVNTC